MATISFEHVSKVYGDGTLALEDANFDVADGEFLVLVGPSGCGKTTTLELVAGLQRPSEGEIRIDGRVVNDLKPQHRGIAMVFQDYALYPHKTVRENLRFGLKYTTDFSREEMDERVVEIAELLGIEGLLDQKPRQLSGGQQQRVALGRAIVRDPEAFLLDEPLSNLDAKLRTEMRAELQRLQTELDVTTVYVTHDQTEAMTMGDRICVLNQGRIQQVGTPDDVFNRPTNVFVADFIGSPSINLFEGRYAEGTVETDRFSCRVEDPALADHDGEPITAGIRPQDLEIRPAGDGPTIEAEVTVVEALGSENVVHLGEDESEVVAQVPESVRPSVGERVVATFDPSRLYVFDANGETIKTRAAARRGEVEAA